ncbi:jg20517 [Pararge aegeria aegeria]|uniref:Jg20517 protein n=1 Tax=Pararge aegeria aegeria TaxID=348720 RepID=A0A8S4SHJ9_9NEOP|nr:jg20517 [Pararge aegeria aegeria]
MLKKGTDEFVAGFFRAASLYGSYGDTLDRNNRKIFLRAGDRARGPRSEHSFFGRTLADNHLRGCYGVTGGVGRARKLAMRRAPGLDDIGGEVGDVDVNLTVGGLLD